MSDLAKKARAALKAKAKRLGTDRPTQKVDSSTFTPPELLDADVKTGLRPISRRAYKSGGKVQGECAPVRADRKARKSGGEATAYANAKINRNVKAANEEREGKKHIGGLKRGGRAHKAEGGMLDVDDFGAGSGVRTDRKENVSRPKYNEDAVDSAISSSNRAGRKVGAGETRLIKSLLKGRTKKNAGGANTANRTTTREYREELERRQNPPASSAPQNAPLPPRRPADLPRDEGMTPAEAERFMNSRKSGGRTKKAIGGAFGQFLSPALMVANALRGDRDKDEKKDGGRAKKKAGGRAKKEAGGLAGDPRTAGNAILQGSAAASGVPQDRLGFAPSMPSQGIKKFLGLKKGGKVHEDAAMDKALIKKMVKADARTGKKKGGEVFSGKGYPGKVPGATGGRKAKADGGTMVDNPRQYTAAENALRSSDRRDARMANEAAKQKANDARQAFQAKQSAIRDASNEARRGMNEPGTAANAAKLAGTLTDQRVRTPSYGSTRPVLPAQAAAPAQANAARPQVAAPAAGGMRKKGGRVKKFAGGALGYAQGGMPAPMPSRGGAPAPGAMGRPMPMPNMPPMPPQAQGNAYGRQQMDRGFSNNPGRGMQGYGNDMLYPGQFPPGTGGPSAPPPTTGGPLPPVTGGPLPMYNKGGRVAYKKGGKVKKGKTNINIVIQAGKADTAGMDVPNPMMAGPVPPPPAPPIMPPDAGAPPPGMPPMPPGGMPPGPPPMMGRKSGGRVHRSYKDMDAGAGSGLGRLEKSEIASRSGRKAGGKVYRGYKDMDAGAGSGLGRLEKSEIQRRK